MYRITFCFFIISLLIIICLRSYFLSRALQWSFLFVAFKVKTDETIVATGRRVTRRRWDLRQTDIDLQIIHQLFDIFFLSVTFNFILQLIFYSNLNSKKLCAECSNLSAHLRKTYCWGSWYIQLGIN